MAQLGGRGAALIITQRFKNSQSGRRTNDFISKYQNIFQNITALAKPVPTTFVAVRVVITVAVGFLISLVFLLLRLKLRLGLSENPTAAAPQPQRKPKPHSGPCYMGPSTYYIILFTV